MQSTLQKRARETLDANTLEVERDGRMYRFAAPTGDTGVNAYRIPKFQWTGWDSQFHSIVYSVLGDVERARQELESILANQQPDGFIPHVTFWDAERLPSWAHLESSGRLNRLRRFRPTGTAHIQPPLLAEVLQHLYKLDRSVLGKYLLDVGQYYRWLSEHRDPDGDGLISVIAQAETGLDYTPAFDPVVGYTPQNPEHELHRGSRRVRQLNKWLWNYNLKRIFRHSPWHTEDVLVNSIYIKNLGILADLADVSRETSLKNWARSQQRRTLHSLIEKSFDREAGLFWNLYGKDEESARVKTVASLMPLIIPELPAPIVDKLVGHLTNPDEFWTDYPVPSTALDEPAFSADSVVDGELRIWRGPLSMNTNWYLVHGLRQHGYEDIAEDIASRSRDLATQHGFNEFYNPLSGEPCGANQFGWATLVVAMS